MIKPALRPPSRIPPQSTGTKGWYLCRSSDSYRASERFAIDHVDRGLLAKRFRAASRSRAPFVPHSSRFNKRRRTIGRYDRPLNGSSYGTFESRGDSTSESYGEFVSRLSLSTNAVTSPRGQEGCASCGDSLLGQCGRIPISTVGELQAIM